MNLRDVEENLEAIEVDHGPELLYELLRAYGLPKASISRLKSGTYDKAEGPSENLWTGKVYFRTTDSASDDLYAMIEVARSDDRVIRESPRFLIIENGDRVLARDQQTAATLDIQPSELAANAAFFMPWAGVEKTQLENLSVADVKAAEKMAKLYDEITRHNEIETEEQHHDLNVFFSRLLFCFFAEDTGVFESASFTNAVGSLTQESGSDMASFLNQLFELLDTEPASREGAPEHLKGFGHVNGKLFSRHSHAPHFTAKARSIVLECGTLDWSQINPDIFGSMMQAVVQPSEREGLGMHYTSVENILKVIRPLFLDEIEESLIGADTVKKLERLLDQVAAIQIFDPACGSGNFLVISYKELRRIEHQILTRIAEIEPRRSALFQFSRIDLEHFFGIEIDGFAHEIAILSLWLAKHQMNREFSELFGVEIPLIPLVQAGQITHGNAARLNWNEICDPTAGPTYVLGNPPYAGSSMQGPQQKADFVNYFGTTNYTKNLDYISLWFFKGADYLASGSSVKVGLVSTNSVCQGDHVGLMWPRVLDAGVKIAFAYQSFAWSNSARGRAGVTCVIVGLALEEDTPRQRALYSDSGRQLVQNINPYLRPDPNDTIVRGRRTPIGVVPPMVWGSKPTDGGYLNMTAAECNDLLAAEPEAKVFVKRYVGTSEFLKGIERFCLWIPDDKASEAAALPEIKKRLERVAEARSRGSTTAQAMADRPYRFLQRAHKDTDAIIVPGVSSERREYVPIGFVDGATVISNLAYAVYEAELWLFSVIQSRAHMVWLAAVGGRMETRYRYTNTLVYNTFPLPRITEDDRGILAKQAMAVLAAREQFPDLTMSERYDPDAMPTVLRDAHVGLDQAVDRLYRQRPFESDDDRLRHLFEMYEAHIEAVE